MFRRPRLKDVLLTPETTEVGENRPVVYTPSSPSRELRLGAAFGTCRVCRCFNCVAPGWAGDETEGEAALGEGYVGGEENRCGPGIVLAVLGVSVGVGVAGSSDVE